MAGKTVKVKLCLNCGNDCYLDKMGRKYRYQKSEFGCRRESDPEEEEDMTEDENEGSDQAQPRTSESSAGPPPSSGSESSAATRATPSSLSVSPEGKEMIYKRKTFMRSLFHACMHGEDVKLKWLY